MASWFVVRGGREKGPLTTAQVKAMAAAGKLLPSDQVRRDDGGESRPASTIKGLFPNEESALSGQPPPSPVRQRSAAPTPVQAPAWEHPALIAASAVFCFPVGLFLVWRNPAWGTRTKGIWTGAVAAGFLLLMVLGTLVNVANRKALAEADSLWRSGDKAAAVAKYRPLLSHIPKGERELAYGRVIDFDIEKGDVGAAKKMAAEAVKFKVAPSVSHPDAKALIQREEAVARGEALTADFYPFKKGTVQHTMATVYFSKSQMQSRREYTHESEGVITKRYVKHFTVPGYNNLALPKPTTIHHREKEGFVEIGDPPDADLLKEAPALAKVEGFSDIRWHPLIKIGAAVGDEWEHNLGPKQDPTAISERYRLVQFSTDEVRNQSVKAGESPDKYLVALIERRTKVTVSEGKIMENVEEIKLGKGIGPVSWKSFRIENGQRVQNWGENVSPVVKE